MQAVYLETQPKYCVLQESDEPQIALWQHGNQAVDIMG